MSAMLSRTVVAIPDRSDAPTTAIERGANSRSRSNARREPPAGTAAGAPPAKRSNRRNGRSRKTVQGDLGEVTIATPRDRNGTSTDR